jgi:diadenosine tetraphosphate (Ap4A) HIT family hydrolase
MDEKCDFCQIDAEKNRIVWHNENIIVVLSNPRLMVGHMLVIPRYHVSNLQELGLDRRHELIDVASFFQDRIKEICSAPGKPAGCDMSQHDRPFMPTTRLSVPGHLHVHLKPRYWKDAYWESVLSHETDFFKEATSGEMEGFRRLIISEA